MKDTRLRSLSKTVSWRVLGIGITVLGIGWATGDWALAIEWGLIINLIKTGIYYLHERFWEQIDWGRK